MLELFILLGQTGGQGAPPGQGGPPPWTMWVWILIFIGAMYFLLLRPQQKQQKELRRMISEVKTNDRVVTSSGIHGVVTNVKDKTFVIRIADGVKVEFEKSAVSRLVEKSSEASQSK